MQLLKGKFQKMNYLGRIKPSLNYKEYNQQNPRFILIRNIFKFFYTNSDCLIFATRWRISKYKFI